MKKTLLILSALGIGIVQTSSAVETTYESNNTLAHITNTDISQRYGSTRNIYRTNGGAYVYSDDEINQVISNLASANQKASDELYEYKLQAEQGDIEAQKITAVMYLGEKGITKDYHQAFFWFEKAAKQGDIEAQMMTAIMYLGEKGIAKDYHQAFFWFEKAAKQGEPLAQTNVGKMYFSGEGVRQDYTKAKEWFEKAAYQNQPEAQGILGGFYEYGIAVRQDYAKAKEVYGQACDNGFQEGCDSYRKLNQR